MKQGKRLRAVAGVLLVVAGFFLARATPYRETTVIINAGSCHLVTDVFDQGNDETRGSVVLFHGLSANKKIMAYIARGFAGQNLRVFVPDLPGHGRTEGPFSFDRAESCAEALVRALIARRAIDAQRTMLAGHSMGGAIALRVASRVTVAGVVAISPAPQRAALGLPADMLPYTNPPPLPPHTLAISAALEPLGIRDATRDLLRGDDASTSRYLLVPRATHVSVLFDPRVVHAAQEWSAQTLKFPVEFHTPSAAPWLGGLAGLVGILLLAGPFIRETLDMPRAEKDASPVPPALEASTAATTVRVFRALLEVAAISLLTVVVLAFWSPLAFIRLYNGGYFAGFLLLSGVALLLLHRKWVSSLWPAHAKPLLFATLAAFVLHLLITGWLDITLTEAWISWARWERFPVLLVAAFACLLAEERLLGPITARGAVVRVWLALTLRVIAFVALLFGIFVLHSGAILLLLLALYLAVFFLFQRLGMDLVRRQTGSPIAAALFGAILLAGLCLVIFPVT